MKQIKMKLVTIIDRLYDNLHFTLYGESYHLTKLLNRMLSYIGILKK